MTRGYLCKLGTRDNSPSDQFGYGCSSVTLQLPGYAFLEWVTFYELRQPVNNGAVLDDVPEVLGVETCFLQRSAFDEGCTFTSL